MADLVYTPTERSRARARRRELTQEASLLARLDWLMLGAVLGIVAFGVWSIAGITRHDVVGSPDLQAEGLGDQFAGKVQKVSGNVRDAVTGSSRSRLFRDGERRRVP